MGPGDIKVVAVIPARGGSKRIPEKNIKLLANKPLIAYSIEEARKSGFIDRIIVSTDDPRIEDVARTCGAEVFKRPAELAQDDSSTEDALLNVVGQLDKEGYAFDYLILLQATSPLRRMSIIDEGMRRIIDSGSDSLLSVSEVRHYYLSGHFEGDRYKLDYTSRPFSHEMPKRYKENGALYITKMDFFVKNRNRIGGKMVAIVMNEVDSIDIDEQSDFDLVEKIVEGKYYVQNQD